MVVLRNNRYREALVLIIILLSLIGLLMLSSCGKEEPLWKLPPPGPEETDHISMGEMYDDCVFYKFSTKTQTTRSLNTWHLAFESAASGWNIRMNGGLAMQIYNTGETDFTKVPDATASSNWDWDTPDGNIDSTAVGKWFISTVGFESKQQVYVIDMGLNAAVPYKKLQVLGMNDSSFTIRYANLNGSEQQTKTILKSTLSTYTYFNLLNNTSVSFEPAPSDYDILFTRYRFIFFEAGEVTPYLVNGAMLNPVSTQAARIAGTTNFDSITRDLVKDIPLSNKIDTIGYDWKYYDFGASKYTVVPNLYLVKDTEGSLWKLQFVDFYNESGVKGYPKFKFQRL